jgi:hypothetical protein
MLKRQNQFYSILTWRDWQVTVQDIKFQHSRNEWEIFGYLIIMLQLTDYNLPNREIITQQLTVRLQVKSIRGTYAPIIGDYS